MSEQRVSKTPSGKELIRTSLGETMEGVGRLFESGDLRPSQLKNEMKAEPQPIQDPMGREPGMPRM